MNEKITNQKTKENHVENQHKEHLNPARRNDYYSLLNPFLSLFDDSFSHDFSNNSNILKTDITERKDGYLFEVEVPGIDKKDVSINLNKGYLEIGVKTNKKVEEDGHKKIHSERFYGSYSRSYFVGYDIKRKDISAKLENGVLKVNINKPAEEKNEDNFIEIE